MLGSLLRKFRQNAAESKVREAVEAGVGVYHTCWQLGGDLATALKPEDLDSVVLEWARSTMAEMRRPYGLDYVTMALAIMASENQETVRYSFGVLRPNDFYEDGPVPEELSRLMREWQAEGWFEHSRWLSVVMFSWGDLTRELLLVG